MPTAHPTPARPLTVADLASRYAAAYAARPARAPHTRRQVAFALSALSGGFGNIDAAAFGPTDYLALRDRVTAAPRNVGYHRAAALAGTTVDTRMNRVTDVFRWGAVEG